MSKKKKKQLQVEEVVETENWEEEKGKPEYVEMEKPKEIIDSHLEGDKVIVWKDWEKVYEPGFYGKQLGDRLELALVEALLLLKRGRIKVLRDNNPMTTHELFDWARRSSRAWPSGQNRIQVWM